MNEVSPQKRAYWQYQYRLGKEYLIPILEQWGIRFRDLLVFDIGCAEGGVLCAMTEAGARAVGLEISPSRLAIAMHLAQTGHRPRIHFVAADFFHSPIIWNHRQPDLIILRDVFEHLTNKPLVVQRLKECMHANTKLFITFPPFYAPFGGHQQMLKSWLRRLPYFHAAPGLLWKMFRWWIRRFDGNPDFLTEMENLRRNRITITLFRKLIRANGLKIRTEQFYISRPSYHIRFGWPIISGNILRRVPLLRECLISGAYFLIERTSE